MNNWKITKTKLKCTRTKRSSNNSKQNRDRKRIIYKTTIDNHSNFSKQKINFRTFSLCVFIDKLFPLHHFTDELKLNKKHFSVHSVWTKLQFVIFQPINSIECCERFCVEVFFVIEQSFIFFFVYVSVHSDISMSFAALLSRRCECLCAYAFRLIPPCTNLTATRNKLIITIQTRSEL